MVRNTIQLFVAVLQVFCVVSAFGVDFDFVDSGGNGIILTAVRGSVPRDLLIPSTYAGRPVYGVGARFLENADGLQTVRIAEGVRSIGYKAFSGCGDLSSVDLPASMMEIQGRAFTVDGLIALKGSSKLKEITVDKASERFCVCDGVLIDKEKQVAIVSVRNVKSLILPSSVKEIGARCFSGCSVLNDVSVGSGLENISQEAFLFCRRMKTMQLCGTRLKSIARKAFSGCDALTEVELPETLENLAAHAFRWCNSLRRVVMHGNAPVITYEVDEWGDANRYPYVTSNVDLDDTKWTKAEYWKSGHPIESVVTYVEKGSSGWGAVPGVWQECRICYIGDEVIASLYGPFVPGESVSLSIPALAGYAAKGLPSGLKLNKNAGEISGTPTKSTGAAGVSVTFTKKGAETLTAKFIVGPIPTVNVTLAGDTDKCKVSGANKAYLVGKKVSLAAKAPKGTAFVGWFKDGEPWPSATESCKAKLSFVMSAESLELVAKFEKEKMSLACPGLAVGKFTVGVGGADEGIPLEISTQSGVKLVKATKLPTGMKLVKGKATGEWMITGVPTKAGSYNVVLTVMAVSGATESIVIPITVEALPDWAVGTFVGVARQVDLDAVGNVVRDGEGLHDWYGVEIAATVSANGKISGKVVFPGRVGSLSFNALSYTGFSHGCYRVSGVEMSAKGLKMVLDLTVSERMVEDAVSAGDMTVAAHEVASNTPGCLVTVATDEGCPLRQSIWKMKGVPLPPSVSGKVVSIERDGYVYTLAFGKDGAVTDTLVLATDPKKVLKKGKPIFSVVDYADGVWRCELFGSVILDTPEGGEARIQFCVKIADDGGLTCELVE